jgi:rhodanese-related sulfurtransferase
MSSKATNQLLRIGSVGIAAVIAWFAWKHASQDAARTHDFGPVPLNARLTHDLVIKNPTATDIAIRGAKPGCTCLHVAEPIPTQIPANGQITLHVTIVPEKLGPVRSSITLDVPPMIQSEWLYRAEVIPPPEALPAPEVVKAAHERLKQEIVLPAAAAVTLAEGSRSVIDVRSPADFQTSTIVGAMNVPLVQLAALPSALRKQRTLVLDRGYGADSTAEVVTRLRRDGWRDLQIIEGGLSAWHANGGRITSSESPDAWLISSDEARVHATRPGWVIAAPEALARSWHLQELFPEVLTFSEPDAAAAEHLAASINTRRPGEGASTSSLHVLIATEGGENATSFTQALRSKVAGSPLFVLEGGLRDYFDHLRTLKANESRQWITMAQFAGALAELRVRQRVVSSCSSCPK